MTLPFDLKAADWLGSTGRPVTAYHIAVFKPIVFPEGIEVQEEPSQRNLQKPVWACC